MKPILQKEEPVLRKKAKEINPKEITSPKIQKILKEMSESLSSQEDGVALAAPQIGYDLRIFVVSGNIFSPGFEKGKIKKEERLKDLYFINPQIINTSKKKEWMPEGCLSVRPFYGETYRSKKTTVTAYNKKGEKITRGGSGLLAQIFQHETDHLEGVLFIDKAKNVRKENLEHKKQN